MKARQFRDEMFVFLGLCAAQLVVEVNNGKNNPQFTSQLQQKAQQGDGIGAPRDGNPHPMARPQKTLATAVFQYMLRKARHGSPCYRLEPGTENSRRKTCLLATKRSRGG